jgi:hypothetical protein
LEVFKLLSLLVSLNAQLDALVAFGLGFGDRRCICRLDLGEVFELLLGQEHGGFDFLVTLVSDLNLFCFFR